MRPQLEVSQSNGHLTSCLLERFIACEAFPGNRDPWVVKKQPDQVSVAAPSHAHKVTYHGTASMVFCLACRYLPRPSLCTQFLLDFVIVQQGLYQHLNSISFIQSTCESFSSRGPIQDAFTHVDALIGVASATPRWVCRSRPPHNKCIQASPYPTTLIISLLVLSVIYTGPRRWRTGIGGHRTRVRWVDGKVSFGGA